MYVPRKLAVAQTSQPLVSIIMPVRNERDHIRESMKGLLEQDYAKTEILVVDGASTDGTDATLKEMESEFPEKIRVLQNRRVLQVHAMNLGLKEARGQAIMIAGAHASYERSFVSKAVRKLMETGAAGVGCPTRLMSEGGLVARAINAIHRSKLGVAVAKFRDARFDGWADTFWMGVYWRHIMQEVGQYRDELERGHDIELHSRIRALGYGLYLDRSLQAYYIPRRTFAQLWSQNFGNGMGIAQLLFVNPKAVSLRHLVPLTFVLTLFLLSIFSVPYPFLRYLVYGYVTLYAAAVLAFSVLASLRESLWTFPLIPLTFVIFHFSYGLGTLWGMAKVTLLFTLGKDLRIFEKKADT